MTTINLKPPKAFWIMLGIALIIGAIGYAFFGAGPVTTKAKPPARSSNAQPPPISINVQKR